MENVWHLRHGEILEVHTNTADKTRKRNNKLCACMNAEREKKRKQKGNNKQDRHAFWFAWRGR